MLIQIGKPITVAKKYNINLIAVGKPVVVAIEIRCFAYTDRKAYYRSKEIQY
jgi:hypothetical protein